LLALGSGDSEKGSGGEGGCAGEEGGHGFYISQGWEAGGGR
jgi:hypothetical protein